MFKTKYLGLHISVFDQWVVARILYMRIRSSTSIIIVGQLGFMGISSSLAWRSAWDRWDECEWGAVQFGMSIVGLHKKIQRAKSFFSEKPRRFGVPNLFKIQSIFSLAATVRAV